MKGEWLSMHLSKVNRRLNGSFKMFKRLWVDNESNMSILETLDRPYYVHGLIKFTKNNFVKYIEIRWEEWKIKIF